MKEMIVDEKKIKDFMDSLQSATGFAGHDIDARVKNAKRVKKAMQAFIARPETSRKQIQGFTTKNDLPDVITNAMAFQTSTNYDLNYEDAFRVVPIEEGRDYWETLTTTPALTFRKIPEGEKVLIESVSGTKVTNYVNKYGGGVGWTDEMIRFRKVNQIVDTAMAFRDAFYSNKADNHYTLMQAAAVATGTTAYDATGSTVVDKDVNTVNNAAYTLANSLKDSGYGDMASAQFILYVNPTLKARMERAFGELSQSFSGSTGRLQWNVQIRYTFNSNVYPISTTGVLCLPGRKAERATVMELTNFNDQDITNLTYIQTAFSYYGAAISDIGQFRNVAFA